MLGSVDFKALPLSPPIDNRGRGRAFFSAANVSAHWRVLATDGSTASEVWLGVSWLEDQTQAEVLPDIEVESLVDGYYTEEVRFEDAQGNLTLVLRRILRQNGMTFEVDGGEFQWMTHPLEWGQAADGGWEVVVGGSAGDVVPEVTIVGFVSALEVSP